MEQEQTYIHTREHNETEVTCVVHASPRATVRWYRNGERMTREQVRRERERARFSLGIGAETRFRIILYYLSRRVSFPTCATVTHSSCPASRSPPSASTLAGPPTGSAWTRAPPRSQVGLVPYYSSNQFGSRSPRKGLCPCLSIIVTCSKN